ncbi:MAG: putative sulfate/molybdate transporter, partial [Polaromonas sp.]|nr:putative sulfate/molybdate transporter [Polaromonas sp.]
MSTTPPADPASHSAQSTNRYDAMEWAGAFGDLGTLIPFIVAYIGVLKLDPFGILFAFGLSMVVCGLYYKTPFPVQPMKAIGAVASIQAVQTALVTPAAVYIAALATGAIWLILGMSGLMARLTRLVPAAVVMGIVLGLGLGFMLQGIRMMQTDWLIAIIGAVGTLLLMRKRRFPAMFVLLAFGVVAGAIARPDLLASLGEASVGFQTPSLALTDITWNQVFVGVVLLA